MADGCCGRGGCSGSRHDLRDGGQPAHRCEHPGRHAQRAGRPAFAERRRGDRLGGLLPASDDTVFFASSTTRSEVVRPAVAALRGRHRVVPPPQGDPGAQLRAQRPRAYDAARPR